MTKKVCFYHFIFVTKQQHESRRYHSKRYLREFLKFHFQVYVFEEHLEIINERQLAVEFFIKNVAALHRRVNSTCVM